MKRVEFFSPDRPLGEVRLLDDGTLEYSNKDLQKNLENQPVMLAGGVYLRPTDDDKEAWLMSLPQGFCGSYFWASTVIEE